MTTTAHPQTSPQPGWRPIYRLGAAAALLRVFVALAEMGISFLPGGDASTETVIEWFLLFQSHPLMGLRNMGLLNMGFNALAVPTYLALYAAHGRHRQRGLAALAAATALLGVAIFFATNRAFAMLDLSRQVAATSRETTRASLVAAGHAAFAVGGSHTPGTFPAFFLAEMAGILASVAMLSGFVFGRAAAWAGIAGFSLMGLFEILSAFAWGVDGRALTVAAVAGLLTMAWNVLLARTLLRLGRGEDKRAGHVTIGKKT